jgi:hypothetical protein
MRFAYWVTKATNAHLEHVTFTAFQQQQWLRNSPQYYVIMPVLSFWVPSMPNDAESYQQLGGCGQEVSVELHYQPKTSK